MTLHTTINTLPVDCYMLIQESISKNEPDFSFLVVRSNYLEKPDKMPDNYELLQAWQSILFSFGEGQLNNKSARLQYEIQLLLNKMLLTNDQTITHLIDRKISELETIKDKNNGFTLDSYYDTCTQIAIHLNIQLLPFVTTTRQYFAYIKELNRISETAKRYVKKQNR